MAGTRILWVDDDATGMLAQVSDELQQCGCVVDTALDVERGLMQLRNSRITGAYDALLVDVVMPRGRRVSGLARHLGVTLADSAAREFRIRTIGFLTVIDWHEIENHFDRLTAQHSHVTFRYFHKAWLGNKAGFQRVSDFARVACKGRSAPP